MYSLFILSFFDLTLHSPDAKVLGAFMVLLVLLFMSGLVSASEIAYFSLNPKETYELEEKEGNNITVKRIHQLLDNKPRLLATILIFNNFINIAIVIIAAYISGSLFDFSKTPLLGFLIEVVMITFIILFFAELLPKLYATNYKMNIARLMALPMVFLSNILKPFSFLLIKISSFLKKHPFIHPRHDLSLTDLSQALEITAHEGDEDKRILKGIVEFGNIEVKEIMCPRTDVVAVDKSEAHTKVVSIIIESGYSRIPVYDGSFDHIKGILYIKDLLPYIDHKTSFNWIQLIRPAYFVPETKKINILLSDFQKNKIHMAIVVDEFGGTSGIITMEDILEEIVGEITDEFDTDEPIYTKIDENTYLFEGKILLNDFYKITQVSDDIFEDVVGVAETLAGLILEIKGEIPQKREKIEYKKFNFIIESVDKKRINRVKVIINDEKKKKTK